MNQPILLIDGNRGQYIPQEFAKDLMNRGYNFTHNRPIWKDVRTLLSGPDNEWYWEAWESLMDKLTFANKKYPGTPYHLEQHDDLWAVPEGYDFGSY